MEKRALAADFGKRHQNLSFRRVHSLIFPVQIDIQNDLENVDWERMAQVYAAAFGNPTTVARIENIFHHANVWRIARAESVIVGAVYAFWDGELDAVILGLVVHPDFQKRDVGRALMEAIIAHFRPGTALLLTSETQNFDFYRQFGFKPLKSAMGLGFPADQLEN